MRGASLAILAREESFHEKIKLLGEEIRRWMYGDDAKSKMCATAQVGWDKGFDRVGDDPTDVGARPISIEDWQEAFKVAMKIAWAAPWMPRPTPGAHTDGFVSFYYEHGENRTLLVECRLKGDSPNGQNPRLAWTVKGPLAKHDLTSPISLTIAESVNSAVREIAESARSVFGEGLS